MIMKTMTITSIAILIAAVSVATTMTLVQADITNTNVDINVPTATDGLNTGIPVVAGAEYSSAMMVVDAELEFVDDGDGIINSLDEIQVNEAGTGVHGETFIFASAGTDGEIVFTDANADNKVQHSELSFGVMGDTLSNGDTATLTADAHPIDVDIDNGTVEIDLSGGSPTTSDIVVTIDNIEWDATTGAIGSFDCTGNVGATSTAEFDENTLVITISPDAVDDVIDINCAYKAFHGSIDKEIVGDCILEVKKSTSQVCTFKITYDGASATIVDTISAGWEEDPVVFTNDDDKCSVDESNGNKGKNKKGNDKSATGFTCNNVGTSAEIDVTIETRESPGKGHGKKMQVVYKPTSCDDPFDINSGAKAILLDMDGNVVLGTLDGKPIVLDTSDSLSVFAVNNDSDGILCDDA